MGKAIEIELHYADGSFLTVDADAEIIDAGIVRYHDTYFSYQHSPIYRTPVFVEAKVYRLEDSEDSLY